MNLIWIRTYSAYSEPMTLHAPGGLESSQRNMLHCPAKSGSGHQRQSTTSYLKSDSVNWCTFTWSTIQPNFIPIRFGMKDH